MRRPTPSPSTPFLDEAPVSGSCRNRPLDSPTDSLADLVCQYRESESYRWQEYVLYQWFGDPTLSLEAAIDRAIRSEKPDGKLYEHQRRIGRSRLNRITQLAQQQIERFRQAQNWEELYTAVKSLVAQVDRAGDLTTYDITNRIGSYFRYEQTVLRVSQGAEQGAIALGLKIRCGSVALEDLPPPLQSLGAMHTENFLCVYKQELKTLRSLELKSRTGGEN